MMLFNENEKKML